MAKSKKNEETERPNPEKESGLTAEERFEAVLKERRRETLRSAETKTLISVDIDVSGSMVCSGGVDAAKAGLALLNKGIAEEDLLKLSVELRIGIFAELAKTARRFGPVNGSSDQSLFNELPAVGTGTRIADAAIHTVEEIERHQAALRQDGQNIRYCLAFFFTDGEDMDSEGLKAAGQRIRQCEAKGGFRFFAIGVDNADMKQLAILSDEPVKLSSINDFSNFFRWLLPVSRALSQSQTGEKIKTPDPVKSEANPEGWSEKYNSIG